jgi:gliding motility associated protien GldN
MNTNLFIIAILFFSVNSIAQGVGPSNVIIPQGQPSSGVIDGVYEKKDVLAKKRAIPYEHVRESDYIWGKRTWSYIDLREKINHPLYYPLEEYDNQTGKVSLMPQGRYSLYFILKTAMLNGQIMGYRDQIIVDLNQRGLGLYDKKGGDDFSLPAQRDFTLSASQDLNYRKDIGNGMIGENFIVGGAAGTKEKTIGQDSVYWLKGNANISIKLYDSKDQNGPYQLDPLTETTVKADAEKVGGVSAIVEYRLVEQEWYRSEQVIKYKLKEDWFFDKERSVLDVRIIGLAPVIKVHPDSVEKIAFWVYFPQARDVLKNYYAYDAKSTVGGNTFDHLFMTRRFNAVVYKESSLYDRKVEDYRFGADALYESEKVKNTIRSFEHDVWNF